MTINDLKQDVDLFMHTTMKIKATAQYFFIAKTKEEIVDLFLLAKKENLKLIILGGGSNLIFLSNYINGIVVKNLYIQRKIIKDDKSFTIYKVSSGYPTNKLVNELINEGLEGIEYHLGLPGTIGGAIYMNSKWTKPLDYFGEHLVKADLLYDDGSLKEVNRDYFNFSYDYSKLHDTKEILIDAYFNFKKTEINILKKRGKDVLEYRKLTQPSGVFTSGCVFQNITKEEMLQKNLQTNSAGYLIDKAGLKGKKIGGFTISSDHANFIFNDGTGKPEDLKKLLNLIKASVKTNFGINLIEEVVLVN